MKKQTLKLEPVPDKPAEEIKTPKETEIKKPLGRGDKIFIAVLSVIFLFIFYIILDANKYQAVVHVIDGKGKIGINPTTESLDFGDLSLGSSAVRRVRIQNGTPIPMYVAIFKTGKVGGIMDIDKNNFTLKGKEDVQIDFTVYMPASATIDSTYKGRVYLFKIPWFK